jgi:hypothetical protein
LKMVPSGIAEYLGSRAEGQLAANKVTRRRGIFGAKREEVTGGWRRLWI